MPLQCEDAVRNVDARRFEGDKPRFDIAPVCDLTDQGAVRFNVVVRRLMLPLGQELIPNHESGPTEHSLGFSRCTQSETQEGHVEDKSMYLKNCWYCAGWEFDLSQSRDALLPRQIAGELLVLYRKLDGSIIAMEDRCCHRQAPLSLGMKEDDGIRCRYHGIKFDADGRCIEIPGQTIIPKNARVRTFPVVVKDSWIWVWMGDPDKADPSLICFAVGPDDAEWNIRTGQISINVNYRLAIANLMDLSHVAWVHRDTLGGTTAWFEAPLTQEIVPRGINTSFWMPDAPPPTYFQHLFPPNATFDICISVEMTVPCNFILRFEAFSPGTATHGRDSGQKYIDSYSSQAVTPRDEDGVDYYYSFGLSQETEIPGMSQTFLEATHAGFAEDKAILEGQHRNIKQRPDGSTLNIKSDGGPIKFLRLLDKLIKDEQEVARTTS